MSFTTKTLGEICDEGGGEVRTGPFGSQLHESDYSPSGIPVVMPKDIIEGKISELSIARVSDELKKSGFTCTFLGSCLPIIGSTYGWDSITCLILG